jgi:hypothetical protein
VLSKSLFFLLFVCPLRYEQRRDGNLISFANPLRGISNEFLGVLSLLYKTNVKFYPVIVASDEKLKKHCTLKQLVQVVTTRDCNSWCLTMFTLETFTLSHMSSICLFPRWKSFEFNGETSQRVFRFNGVKIALIIFNRTEK